MSNPSARSPLWLLEQLLRRFYLVVVVAVCLAIVVSQTALYGAVVNSWDWLLVSGFGTWLAAVYFQFLLPEKLTETLT
ncbi:MAG: hypothetical protein JO063_09055, partial [Pseudonocardiales bacterium]|nr:hypothetical protein [Pseudonocardiales bacterium]